MLKTSSWRNARKFFTKNYNENIRIRGEHAIDDLLGTMLGVLFLAVISASFAGIYMAYVVTSAKAEENTARANIAAKFSAETFNNLIVDNLTGGRQTATNLGWSVIKHNEDAFQPASPDYPNYRYVATRPMKTGSPVLAYQWGTIVSSGPDQGLVKLYTSIPRAGANSGNQGAAKCNWRASSASLLANCIVVYDVQASVISPPPAYTVYPDINWQTSIVKAPWTTASVDYSASTWQSIATSKKLGTIDLTGLAKNADGTRTVKFVALAKDLVPNNLVSFDINKPGTTERIFSYQFTPKTVTGETGNLQRSVNNGTDGGFTLPADVNSVDVYIDTKVTNPDQATGDPAVQLSRFFFYQPKVGA
jgi:hypothetical protein